MRRAPLAKYVRSIAHARLNPFSYTYIVEQHLEVEHRQGLDSASQPGGERPARGPLGPAAESPHAPPPSLNPSPCAASCSPQAPPARRMKTQALVVSALKAPFVLSDIELSAPQPLEVLIKVTVRSPAVARPGPR